MKIEQICVLGGTGFVGGQLVTHLANNGFKLKLLTRHRERHKQFLVNPSIKLIQADVRDDRVLREQVAGCDAVINLIGILNGSEQTFRAVHAELPRCIAMACKELGVQRLLHMSALNADAEQGPSLYLRTKGEGEQAVFAVAEGNVKATIFRPSIIFGPGDSFFNMFASLLRLSPIFPLACPDARFAPVYVDDVVEAFQASLLNEATFGKSLELCGPRVYTFRELIELTAKMIGHRRLIWGLPDKLARLQARAFEYAPGQPFTMDNYRSLQVDSVCHENGFAGLGITPKSVEVVMPDHFAGKYSRTRRYSAFRRTGRN